MTAPGSPIAVSKLRQFTLRALMTWIAVLAVIWGVPSFLPSLTIAAVLATIVYVGFILEWITASKFFRYLAVNGVFIFCAFHLLGTGVPFPIWHIERLRAPVAVEEVGSDVLRLADGRTVSLPLIKEIPANDPVFNSALQRGVEVNENGEIYGLIQWPRFCGNDPVTVNIRRINLSELAGTVNPTGIDDEIVDPAEIARLTSNPSRSTNSYILVFSLNDVREVFATVDRRRAE